MDDDMTSTATAAVWLPNGVVFDILSRTPVKSVCRFRCVSKGWRDLISDPVFLAEHKSRHPEPLLVDTGSFHRGPAESRDLRLMDMDGNLVRVIKVAGGSGILCTTSLDDLICVSGGTSDGAHVVDPATGEMLVTCPPMEAPNRNVFSGLTVLGFGRAVPSGAYKMVRLVGGWSCEILTLGSVDDVVTVTGWRNTQAPPMVVGGRYCNNDAFFRGGSPVSINGVMYFWARMAHSDGALFCLDLESEQWRKEVMEGPEEEEEEEVAGDSTRRRTTSVLESHITEHNGSLCMVQSTLNLKYGYDAVLCDNIWLLADPDNGVWIKAYTIPTTPDACHYTPLRDIAAGKLLLHCSCFVPPRGIVGKLQVYDPRTGKCTDVTGTPTNLGARIGLCSNLHLERLVTR